MIEDPDTVQAELRSRQGATTAVDEEIGRIQATIKTLDAQKQRALRLFTIAEADDSDVKRELARPSRGLATVVYHSVFMQYVAEADRKRIAEVIAGGQVFHLSLEPADNTFEIRLDGRLLGTSGPHGTAVRWNVDSPPR